MSLFGDSYFLHSWAKNATCCIIPCLSMSCSRQAQVGKDHCLTLDCELCASFEVWIFRYSYGQTLCWWFGKLQDDDSWSMFMGFLSWAFVGDQYCAVRAGWQRIFPLRMSSRKPILLWMNQRWNSAVEHAQLFIAWYGPDPWLIVLGLLTWVE